MHATRPVRTREVQQDHFPVRTASKPGSLQWKSGNAVDGILRQRRRNCTTNIQSSLPGVTEVSDNVVSEFNSNNAIHGQDRTLDLATTVAFLI